MILSGLDVKCNCLVLNFRVAHDNKYVSGCGELVDERCKFLEVDDNRLEVKVGIDAGELELLDDAADILEAMHVLALLHLVVRNQKEGRALLEHNLICLECHVELSEVLLERI